MSEEFEELHFTIEGSFLTNHFRNLVLEGEWSKAIDHFQQSLIGMPMDMIVSVLSGDMKLVGINEMTLEKDNESEEYKESVLDLYGRNMYINGAWFKPMAIINTINENSINAADRARIYCPEYDSFTFMNGNLIALERIELSNPPVWLESKLRKHYLPEKVLRGVQLYGVTEDSVAHSESEEQMIFDIVELQSQRGFICDDEDIELFLEEDFVQDEITAREMLRIRVEERSRVDYYSKLRSRIISQANENGGFMKIYSGSEKHDNRVEFSVPRAPFLHWCHMHGQFKDYLSDFLPEWDTISPSGLKMGGDCQYHTDYVIGAGFDPRDFYGNEDFKSAAFRSLHLEMNLDLMTISGSGIISGEVIKVNSNTSIEDCKDKIIVIPEASVEFFEYAKVSKLTITEVGGPGSHLAINSKEFDINLILVENATKFISNDEITFNLDSETFTSETTF